MVAFLSNLQQQQQPPGPPFQPTNMPPNAPYPPGKF